MASNVIGPSQHERAEAAARLDPAHFAEPATDLLGMRHQPLDRQLRRGLLCSPVLLALLYAVLRLLIDLLILRGRPTADHDRELLVLRQELIVLRRTAPRARWRTTDRLILAALGRKLSAGALLLVRPATILGWHRALVRRRWAAFGCRRGPGRPKLPADCRELVMRLAKVNPHGVPPCCSQSTSLSNALVVVPNVLT